MEIYNKGKRDIIIAREDFLSENCAKVEDPVGKSYAHIKPDMVCTISDAVAEHLIKQYPGEIVAWGKQKKKR